jgi:3-polyprenyl-4-hydroxybenzoate decarboxylase
VWSGTAIPLYHQWHKEITMSEYKKRVVQFINGSGEVSQPFTVFAVNGEVAQQLVVSVRATESTNPKTGEIREELTVSGEAVVASHNREWLAAVSAGFITTEGYAVIVPMQTPSVEEVLAAL